MATLDAKGRSLGSYCQGNWCRWNAQTEKKESAWFWPLNWKSEWQTLTLWLYSLIKVSLFWPYYGSLKGFQSNPCRLAATKSADAFDVQGTVKKINSYLNAAQCNFVRQTSKSTLFHHFLDEVFCDLIFDEFDGRVVPTHQSWHARQFQFRVHSEKHIPF